MGEGAVTKIIIFVLLGIVFMGNQLYSEMSKESLFCTPSFISAKISPDGNSIAYVGADKAGIANLYIKDKPSTQLTFFTTPEMIHFCWSANSDKIVFLRDENGTGQLGLYGVDIHSKQQIAYTEKYPKANAKIRSAGPLAIIDMRSCIFQPKLGLGLVISSNNGKSFVSFFCIISL